MSSLSRGPLQKATRRAILYLLKENPDLRNEFFSEESLATTLTEVCGVEVDAETVSKAFTSGGDTRYWLQLKDMNIGHDGQDVLFVYKAHRLLGPVGNYFTAIGWFDSIEVAEEADPIIRKSVRTRVKDIISIDKDTVTEFTKQIGKEIEKESKRKAKANANQKNKRPSSSSSEEPQRKRTSGAVEQEETSCAIDQETSAAAPTPDSLVNTPAEATALATTTVTYSMGGMPGKITVEVGSELHQMLLEHCNVPSGQEGRVSVEEVGSQISVPLQAVPGSAELSEEMEVEESDHDTPIQQSENERKEYTIGCRDVKVGDATIHNVPNSHEVVQRNHLSRWKKKAEVTDRLVKLFKKGKTVLPPRYLQFLATVSLLNSGGSDKGTVTLFAAMALALIRSIGISEEDISNEDIAKGCLCEATLAEYEYRVAARLIMMKVRQINRSGVRVLSMTTDGGHRKKMDHIVKMLHYIFFDDDGKPRLGHFIIDVDTCGKTADKIAAGIKRSMAPILNLLSDNVKIWGLTGDSGGGGAVQTIFPKLVENGVLEAYSRFIKCVMHALSKPFEVACTKAFGTQGLGKCTVFQLAFSVITFYRKIIEQGGLELLDRYSEKLYELFEGNEEWIEEGMTMFPQAMETFGEKIDDDDYDFLKEYTQSLRNLQLPVMSRWKTMPKALEFLVDNWVPTYFMCVAVTQVEGSQSALYQICCDIISLMTLRPKTGESEAATNTDVEATEEDATGEDATEEDATVEDDVDGDTEVDATAPVAPSAPAAPSSTTNAAVLQQGDTPILLSQALFLVAFSKEFFTPWFDSAMQPDSRFGSDSHGHITQKFVAQTYLMKKELDEMMFDDKWEEMPVFRAFMTSLDGLPSHGDVKKGGLEFIKKSVGVFFREYLGSFMKHIVEPWTHQKIACYIVGGEPMLSREYIRWLNAYQEGALEDESFHWSQEVIELENCKSYGESHEVCIGDCLRYVTQSSNAAEVVEDPFIKEILPQLINSLDSAQVVDFLDSSTWQQEGEYDLVRKQICEMIVPHATQQQRVECAVQNINAMSRTGVKEGRRSARSIIFSISLHRHNRESVDEKREQRTTIKDKLKVKTMKGSERVTHLFDRVLEDLEEAEEAVNEFGQEKYAETFNYIRTPDNKTSTAEREKKVEDFEAGAEKQRNVTKAQRSGEIHVPVDVGGGIPLIYFAKCRSNIDILRHEIAHRKIKNEQDGVQLQLDEEPLLTMDPSEMKELLKKDEAKILASKDMMRAEGTSWTKINSVDPQSEAMIVELANYQAWKASRDNE